MTADTDFKPPTPQEAWDAVWAPLAAPEGELKLDVVQNLLHDYGVLIGRNMILYPYLTDDRITDPQHDLEELIQIADECMAENTDGAIRAVLDEIFDALSQVNTEPEDVQLKALILKLNQIYERGQRDD